MKNENRKMYISWLQTDSIIVQQNNVDEGLDNDEDDDDNKPGPWSENPLWEDNVPNNEGEQDGVLTDNDETQGGNDQAEGSTFNAEGLRRSTRVHRGPSSYIQSRQGNKY